MFRVAPASGAHHAADASSKLARPSTRMDPRITSIQLGILSAEEVERRAPKVITENTTHTKNLPNLGGPNDPALGPCDRRVRCSTCRDTWFGCMGHHGVVRLPVPVYHAGFVDTVYKLLQATCWVCSRLKADLNDPAIVACRAATPLPARDLLLLTYEKGKTKAKCPHCGAPQPRYRRPRESTAIKRAFDAAKLQDVRELGGDLLLDQATREFTPTDAYEILSAMSDEDVLAVGMNPKVAHPSWMVLQNLMVLPPNSRPAIMAVEGSKRKGQDDMTAQTQEILKAARALQMQVLKAGAPAEYARLTRGGAAAAAAAAAKQSTAAAAAAASTTAAAAGTAPPPGKRMTDAKALNARLTVAEFLIPLGGAAAQPAFTEAEVVALRWALPAAVIRLSAAQASSVWASFPVACQRLQEAAAVLFDNSGRFAPLARQRTGGPKRGLWNRWVGKTGRFRGNLVAKRVDMSARTVIKPDAWLDVDELGIPTVFGRLLTVQEDVNPRNLERLTAAVARGPGVAGGAARVLFNTGDLTQLALVDAAGRAAIRLQCGDLVERHLLDGDRVIFNRQPTLHRLSMMVHRIRLIEGLAIAVPLAVVGPYNADFDGDEMNLHVLQSGLALAEAEHIMAVSANVVNPQTNAPCLGLVQDVKVGAMLLTRPGVTLQRDLFHQCLGVVRYPHLQAQGSRLVVPPPAGHLPDGEPYWTGAQVVSLLLPPDMFCSWPGEGGAVIEAGHITSGGLAKDSLGSGTNGLVNKLVTGWGQMAAIRFLSDMQRVVYTWLPRRGLSMGLKDCAVSATARSAIDAHSLLLDQQVGALTKEAASAKLTELEAGRVEEHILNMLTFGREYAAKQVACASTSGFVDMVTAGSKGGPNNLAQVMACLGQQTVEGARMQPTSSGRTLTCFPAGAHSAAARGFVASSYMSGLAPHEFFFHMQGGREGIVATAVKTAETGYGYRQMAKAQENNVVAWDGTIRNGQGYIIEFVAGGDFMNPCKVHRVSLGGALLEEAEHEVGGDAARYAQLRAVALRALGGDASKKVLLPVDVAEETRRAGRQAAAAAASLEEGEEELEAEPDATDAASMAAAVEELIQATLKLLPSPEAGLFLEVAMRWELRPAALRAAAITGTRAFWKLLAPKLYHLVVEALARPGDAAGVVAAQSIGEPSTQFTLNAFHQAGLVQRRMTMGVPRLKELTNASRNIATPSMVVPILAGCAPTAEAASKLAHTLQFTCADDILTGSTVVWDPPARAGAPPTTVGALDAALLDHVAAVWGAGEEAGEALSDWVVRLHLNKAILTQHGLTPKDVVHELATRVLPDAAFLAIYSEPSDPEWLVRLRAQHDDDEDEDDDDEEAAARRLHARIRDDTLISGIVGIRDARVAVTPDGKVTVDTEGSALQLLATRDWADWEHATTNDVQEVAATLGIAAARVALFAEIDRIVCYDGGYVDARHLRALVSTMTHRGFLMPITRHGINRCDFSVFQKASYEEPVDMVLQAATAGEVDNLNGVCQAIIAGQRIPAGTGTVSIYRDIDPDGRPFARPRVPLASREQQKEVGRRGGVKRRLRDDVFSEDEQQPRQRHRVLPREAFLASDRAVQAWRTEGATDIPVRRAAAAAAAFAFRPTGRLVTTTAEGVCFKAEVQGGGGGGSAALTLLAAAAAAAGGSHGATPTKRGGVATCCRPSTPSDVFGPPVRV